jgi:glycosyltransferase involved in cell wall biosynthesis
MLTIYQYSLIAGLQELLVAYKNKYLLRSGFSSLSENNTSILEITAWLKLTGTYMVNFLPFFLSSVPFLCLLFRGCKVRREVFNKNLLTAVHIIIIPIILHHILFFNGTVVHDFFLLKDSVYIAIFGALFYWYFFEYFVHKNRFKYKLSIFFVIWIFLVVAVTIYSQSNKYYSSQYKVIGEKIRMTSSNEEVVFINFENSGLKQINIEPQQIVYSQRNIARWQDNNQAEKLIRLNGLNRGAIFNINNNFDIFSIDHIELKD